MLHLIETHGVLVAESIVLTAAVVFGGIVVYLRARPKSKKLTSLVKNHRLDGFERMK